MNFYILKLCLTPTIPFNLILKIQSFSSVPDFIAEFNVFPLFCFVFVFVE